MPTFSLRNHQNPLIWHLSRHNQVPTLFRFVTPGNAGGPTTLARADYKGAYPSGRIVQAAFVSYPFEQPKGAIPDKEPASVMNPKQQVNVAQPSSSSMNMSDRKPLTRGYQPVLQKQPSSVSGELIPEVGDPAWQRLDSIYSDQQELVQHAQQENVEASSAPDNLKSNQYQLSQSMPTVKQEIPGKIDTEQLSQRPTIQRAAYQPEAGVTRPLYQPLPQSNLRAPSSNESTITDEVWRRLQAIYTAHQEKEQQEKVQVQERIQRTADARTVQATSDVSAPSVESPHGLEAAEPAAKQDDKSSVNKTEGIASPNQPIQKFESTPATAERPESTKKIGSGTKMTHAPNPLRRVWKQVEHIIERQPEEELFLSEPAAEHGYKSPPEPYHDEQSREAMERVTPKAQTLQTGFQPEQFTRESQSSKTEQHIQQKQVENNDADMEATSDELPQQRLPLEAVWAVEQRQNLPPVSVHKTKGIAAVLSSTQAEFPLEQSQEIHKILQKVEPKQQTDSHIEVISPRHGRPLPSPTIQAAPAELRESEQEKGPADILQSKPEPDAQTQEMDGSSRTPATQNPELKKMWNLLDEMHPQDSESTTSMGKEFSRTPVPSSGGNREVTQAVQKAEEPDLHSDHMLTEISFPTPISTEPTDVSPRKEIGVVQKQEAAMNTEDQSLTLGSTTDEKQGKPDINELARQVYAEVRRKIALEWERKRS